MPLDIPVARSFTAKGLSFTQQSVFKTTKINTRHPGRVKPVEPQRYMICHLRGARTAGAGIDERQILFIGTHQRNLSCSSHRVLPFNWRHPSRV
jgi:hypothetical protein